MSTQLAKNIVSAPSISEILNSRMVRDRHLRHCLYRRGLQSMTFGATSRIVNGTASGREPETLARTHRDLWLR
jgi:hypothetical protein